jgi:hypothetical protein
MLADIEQVSVPTWTCLGCASDGPTTIASAAAKTAAAAHAVRNIWILPPSPPYGRGRIVSENAGGVSRPFGYFKLPQKRWMRAQASSSAVVAVA